MTVGSVSLVVVLLYLSGCGWYLWKGKKNVVCVGGKSVENVCKRGYVKGGGGSG